MAWYIIMIMSLLLSVVSTDKSAMIVNTKRESSIATEILAAMINVSLTKSSCCNAFISDKSAELQIIFNKFVKIYAYEYTLNNMTYECDNYLMVFTSADRITTTIKSVPTNIATTQLLIVVNNAIDNSMDIFNVSMYENVKVNIIAWNGQWTLSENYLAPRVFRRMSSHQERTRKKGLANFEGRKLRALAYFRPPFCYLQTTANFTENGIRRQYYITNNDTELDGVEVKLFILIAEQLNFTWRIQEMDEDDKYGKPNGTIWQGGVISRLMKKEVDFAFTSLWCMAQRLLFTNHTKPWTMLHIHFIVPRPKPYIGFWALIKPLSPQLWASIVVTLIIQSIHVHTEAKISSRASKRFRSFTVTWTELMGRLVGMWAPRNIQGFKIQFQIWHMMGILLVTAYSSSLAARLTNPLYEKRIDTAEDFIKANLTWGHEIYPAERLNVIDYSDPYAKQYGSHFEFEIDEEDRHKKMLKGNYAVLGNIIGSSYFPEQLLRGEDLKDFRVMRRSVADVHASFVVQPWLVRSVNQVIDRMHSAGLVKYHIDNVLRRRMGSALRELMSEHDVNKGIPKVLKLKPLFVAFVVLIMGLSISSGVFYLELTSVGATKSFPETCHGLKMKRIAMLRKLKRQKIQLRVKKIIKRSS